MRRALSVLAFCAAAGHAAAQPMLLPGRDVAIVYRLSGAAADRIPGGAPQGVRLLWDAAGQRLRAEALGRPIYALTDLQRRTASLVFVGQGSYIETRIKGGDPQALIAGQDARFTRRGEEHVLGLACTDWAVRSQRLNGTGCVTADGVLLKAEITIGGRPGSVTAQNVAYGALPDSQFAPPEGYARLALPGLQ